MMNKKLLALALMAILAAAAVMAGGPLDKKPAKTKKKAAASKVKSDFDKAVDFFNEGQTDKAYVIFKKELQNARHKGYAATFIASMKMDEGDVQAALDAIKLADGNIPASDSAFNAYFHSEAARVMLATGDTTTTLQLLSEAVNLQPADAFYYDRRGKFFQKLERYDEAAADLRRAAELLPDDMEAQLSLACAVDAQNRFDEAIELFDNVVTRWPDAADGFAYRASTFYNMQDFAAATDDAIRALAIDGENSHALWLLPYIQQQDAAVLKAKLQDKVVTDAPRAALWKRLLDEMASN
ncbi:MAG: hypothetical protein Q4B68_09610 [Bacteroidales bacterium]|nr:hypothetical protein [Bacteroidales bacterium]